MTFNKEMIIARCVTDSNAEWRKKSAASNNIISTRMESTVDDAYQVLRLLKRGQLEVSVSSSPFALFAGKPVPQTTFTNTNKPSKP